jgi:hypothetical protein
VRRPLGLAPIFAAVEPARPVVIVPVILLAVAIFVGAELLRRRMRRHHDRSPIWIDEIGWASARHGSRYAEGPEGQARMLRRALGFARAHRRRLGIGRVLWYPWRDTSRVTASCSLCKSSGLRARSGTSKPAWRAYRRLAG